MNISSGSVHENTKYKSFYTYNTYSNDPCCTKMFLTQRIIVLFQDYHMLCMQIAKTKYKVKKCERKRLWKLYKNTFVSELMQGVLTVDYGKRNNRKKDFSLVINGTKYWD